MIVMEPSPGDRNDRFARVDDLALFPHLVSVADLAVGGDRGKAMRVRRPLLQSGAPAMADQELERLKRGRCGGEREGCSDHEGLPKTAGQNSVAPSTQMWIGFPVAAIAASFSASLCVGWAWQV